MQQTRHDSIDAPPGPGLHHREAESGIGQAAHRPPTVSIGLPVRNGARYVGEAIESILAQTFGDFEVIVSDNASSDATSEICRGYARRDPRVRYFRTERNIGAAPNFNRTFHLSAGRLFRWHAHDDRLRPEYLERCVEVLERDPSIVLCHSKVQIIDEHGEPVSVYDYRPRTGSPRPPRRFYDLLFVKNDCFEVFGLIRSEVLRQTRLQGAFPVGDRVLLAELAFRGRFCELPESLFESREHADRSVRRMVSQRERAAWFDPRYEGRITLPEWRTLAEYIKAIRRAPLSGPDRLLAELCMVKYLRHYRKRMRDDVLYATRTLATRRRRARQPAGG